MAGIFEVRPACNYDEFKQMTLNAGNAFSCRPEFFYDMNTHSPGHKLANTRLAILDGEIVGNVNILSRRFRAGHGELRIGGIADVNMRPELRGRGYASAVLEDCIAYMTSEGYHVSLLFGNRVNFYTRAGWQQIPRRIFMLDAAAMPPCTNNYEVRRIDFLKAMNYLDEFRSHRPVAEHGLMVRDDAYRAGLTAWHAYRNPVSLLALADGHRVGLCMLEKDKDKMRIDECHCLPGHEAATAGLLRAALDLARESGCGHVRGFMPGSHPIAKLMLDSGGETGHEDNLMGMIHNADAIYRETGLSPHGGGLFETSAPLFEMLAGEDEFLIWDTDKF